MSLATDIADDYLFFDGVETVTFAGVTTVKALREPLSRSEVAFGPQIGISPSDVAINLWVSTMGGNTPQPGDTITDASSNVYQILSCQLATLQTRWRCLCKKQL